MTEPSPKELPRAFISSTILGLPEHQVAAVDACLRVGAEPIIVEFDPTSDTGLQVQSLAALDRADIYIGIFAGRYGFVSPGQEKSLTELEYEHAVELGIPRLIFIMGVDHPVRLADVETGPNATKLQSFKTAIRKKNIVAEFRSADELKAAIVTSLVKVLSNSTQQSKAPAAFLFQKKIILFS